MVVSLDSSVLNQLHTVEARKLYELTDKLITCGVGKLVNLPQIIVVGEQSVGESPVLEAVSHARFPVKGNLCTRFATELVLRQGSQTQVKVSVRFDDKPKRPQTIQRVRFREDDLPDVIKEAEKSMEIAATGRDFFQAYFAPRNWRAKHVSTDPRGSPGTAPSRDCKPAHARQGNVPPACGELHEAKKQHKSGCSHG